MTGVGGVIKNPDSTRKSEDGSLNKIETLVYCVYRDSCWPFNSLTNSTDTKIQRVKPTASSCLFASVCILVRSVVLHVKIYLDQALTTAFQPDRGWIYKTTSLFMCHQDAHHASERSRINKQNLIFLYFYRRC